jgi:hypothetical protein
MEFQVATLASYAEIGQDGRVHMVSGCLDTLRSPAGFPITTSFPIFVVLYMLYPANECGRDYRLRVELVRPDGVVLDSVDHVSYPPVSPDGLPSKVGFVIGLQGVTFPAAGRYAVRVLHDEAEVKRMPLTVEEVTR